MRNDFLYAEKQNRDAKARELKLAGYLVRKSSIRNQQIHPMYLEDRKDTLEGRDRGFENTVYKTFFSVLYRVEYQEVQS